MIKPCTSTLKGQRLNVLTTKTPIKEERDYEHSLEVGILIGNNSTKVTALTAAPVLYLRHFIVSEE